MDKIFLKGNVPSSKNSKNFVTLKTGKKLLLHSKTVQKYLKQYEFQYKELKKDFLKLTENKKLPIKLGFYFIRDTKRHFDYINMAQLPLDLMQIYGWIEDDDMEHIIPVFLGYEVDKENAGLILSILD